MSELAWPEARRLAYLAAEPLPPTEVDLADAVGLVLAAPLRALAALPPFDTAAMDGYAVAGPGPWRLAGRRLAGAAPDPAPLAPGTATEIATGAMVPPGATAVLPYEDAARTGDLVAGDVAAGRHVRPAGEECVAGDELAGAGAAVTAALVGLAAAVGHDRMAVHPRPRVALLVSGDELLSAGRPRGGRIRDALGPQLPALAAGAGGRPGEVRYVPDDRDAFAAALVGADGDVVVTTGASSRGPADHLPGVLADAGARLYVRGVGCRPGHPQLLARLPDGRWLVGLPGNPLAALCGVLTLLVPLLARLGGRAMPAGVVRRTGGIRPHPQQTRLVPVVFDVGGDAIPLAFGGAAMLRGAARADGLAVVPPGADPPSLVEVLPLPA